MSTTFSLVVYVKPPHARPTSPSTIRIAPSVLFTAPPSVAVAQCRHRALLSITSCSCNPAPNPQRSGLSARARLSSKFVDRRSALAAYGRIALTEQSKHVGYEANDQYGA